MQILMKQAIDTEIVNDGLNRRDDFRDSSRADHPLDSINSCGFAFGICFLSLPFSQILLLLISGGSSRAIRPG